MNKENIFEKHPLKTLFLFFIFISILVDLTLGTIFINDYRSTIKKFRRPHNYYHHALNKSIARFNKWKGKEYKIITNSLGFRDATSQKISLKKKGERIIFIGDSFTEGVGINYENTFAGLLQNFYNDIEILNAGVISYSPKIYYLKTKFLIENEHLNFDKLFVFIDISDIQDEILYQTFKPTLPNLKSFLKEKYLYWLLNHSLIINRVYWYRYDKLNNPINFINSQVQLDSLSIKNVITADKAEERATWTYRDSILEKWGHKGLEIAQSNMQKLVDLCKKHDITITIAVYPWPSQIKANDKNSIQVKIWEKFSEKNQISFINFFPNFFKNDKEKVINDFFFKEDMHWNRNGHKVIADEIIKNDYLDLNN